MMYAEARLPVLPYSLCFIGFESPQVTFEIHSLGRGSIIRGDAG